MDRNPEKWYYGPDHDGDESKEISQNSVSHETLQGLFESIFCISGP